MTSRDPKKVKVVTAIIFEAPYHRNGARYTHGHYGPPQEVDARESNNHVTDDVT